MELSVWSYFVLLGIAFVGIKDMTYSTKYDALEIQKQVIMDMNDVLNLQEEIMKRKRLQERELYFKGYRFIFK